MDGGSSMTVHEIKKNYGLQEMPGLNLDGAVDIHLHP
jgi:hypothetical protein